MSGLVTLGELLGQVAAEREGPLRPGAPATLSVCGAEATVAIGVRRLGPPAAYIGRSGDDVFGRMGREVLDGEGIDVAHLSLDPSAPTGLLLRTRRTADRSVVEYLRAGSAGSRLGPEDVDPELIAAADLVHVTGITPALSDTAAAAVDRACDLARRSGVAISLDVNHRTQLWSGRSARAALLPLPVEPTSSSVGGTSSRSSWTYPPTPRPSVCCPTSPPKGRGTSSSASASTEPSACATANSPPRRPIT